MGKGFQKENNRRRFANQFIPFCFRWCQVFQNVRQRELSNIKDNLTFNDYYWNVAKPIRKRERQQELVIEGAKGVFDAN